MTLAQQSSFHFRTAVFFCSFKSRPSFATMMAPSKRLCCLSMVFLSASAFSPSFSTQPQPHQHQQHLQQQQQQQQQQSQGRWGVRLHAFAGLARKMKEKEIAGLKEESAELLEARTAGKSSTGEIARLLRKKVPGTVSIVAEYRKKGLNMGSLDNQLPPKIVSRDFRDAGAEAVSVLMDKATGGCTVEDAQEIVKEQATAAGDFPPPAPLIVHDMIIDEVQIAQAASLGAKGVVLTAGVLGQEELGKMMTAAGEYGVEAIVEVKSAEEVAMLEALGVTTAEHIVALSGLSVDETIDLLPTLPKDVVKMAFVGAYNDKQLIEAEDAWRLRDAGCNSIWASEVLFKFGYQDGEHSHSVIKAIKSKGSVKYARASGAYNGFGEGAKEFLGTICD
jgi:indole-3-glycerol phosphate synthase